MRTKPTRMLLAVSNFSTAHRGAWFLAGVLHRDISEGNVLINDTPEDSLKPKAFLNDWDLCKYQDEIDDEATQIYRSVGAYVLILHIPSNDMP